MVDSENLCRRAMEIYGFPAQAAMVVEECSELTNAICKFRRGRVGEDDIITEIADVMIMCEQLSNYFGKEKVALERERKLTRLEVYMSLIGEFQQSTVQRFQIVRILALLLWTSWVRTYYVLGETTILVKSECLFSVEEL